LGHGYGLDLTNGHKTVSASTNTNQGSPFDWVGPALAVSSTLAAVPVSTANNESVGSKARTATKCQTATAVSRRTPALAMMAPAMMETDHEARGASSIASTAWVLTLRRWPATVVPDGEPISQSNPLHPAGHTHLPLTHLPPKRHPAVVQGPISQRSPEKPVGHLHRPFVQTPPFRQGTVLQGPISQRTPENPAGQRQVPSVQAPPFRQAW
jgi:hypothetical protein